uniref:Uncharacterized protein n=1 Tax=Rhizophora mucronata TaxID=61149 RepID=A0A2P2PY58_RHIMU
MIPTTLRALTIPIETGAVPVSLFCSVLSSFLHFVLHFVQVL